MLTDGRKDWRTDGLTDWRTDGRTDGQTENRTPISHPATSRCDKKGLRPATTPIIIGEFYSKSNNLYFMIIYLCFWYECFWSESTLLSFQKISNSNHFLYRTYRRLGCTDVTDVHTNRGDTIRAVTITITNISEINQGLYNISKNFDICM